MSDRKTISVVIPAHNEESNLRALFDALTRTFAGMNVTAEFIFVDDGSTDGSLALLDGLSRQDARVKVIGLSRNFGKEIAITAGVQASCGDAAVIIDADLQHPVELIPEFVRRWQGGAEVVVGIRESTDEADVWRRISSSAFYALLNAVAETPVVRNATDFRLLDRAVIDEFNRFTERQRLTRGLIDWLGFRREFVHFKANVRHAGVTQYGTLKRFRLAMSSVVSHSFFPLRLAGYLGVLITLVSGCLGLFVLIEKYFMGDPLHMNFSGPAILAIINLFLVGIILSCLGLIALYIANIHGEVTNRPLYVVRLRRNLK